MNPFIKRLAKQYKMTYEEVEVIFKQVVEDNETTEELYNRLDKLKTKLI